MIDVIVAIDVIDVIDVIVVIVVIVDFLDILDECLIWRRIVIFLSMKLQLVPSWKTSFRKKGWPESVTNHYSYKSQSLKSLRSLRSLTRARKH